MKHRIIESRSDHGAGTVGTGRRGGRGRPAIALALRHVDEEPVTLCGGQLIPGGMGGDTGGPPAATLGLVVLLAASVLVALPPPLTGDLAAKAAFYSVPARRHEQLLAIVDAAGAHHDLR